MYLYNSAYFHLYVQRHGKSFTGEGQRWWWWRDSKQSRASSNPLQLGQQSRGLAEADIKIDVGYPFVYNDIALSDEAKKQAVLFSGEQNVFETELRMGAEDFAYYTHQIPGCFFRLGAGNKEKGIASNVHTPTFNIDERAIEHGIGMMVWMAIKG